MAKFRDANTRSYCLIGLSLFLLLAVPQSITQYWQGRTAALFGSSWNQMSTLALTSQPLGNRPLKTAVGQDNRRVVTAKEEMQRLELENRQLKERVAELQALLAYEQTTGSQIARPKEWQHLSTDQLISVPARIIYRSPATWNSTLWINVGTATNTAVGRTVIAKNSPVVVGTSLIGVIDLVNERQSRVRLITDSSLVPSVRVNRNGQLLAKGELHGSSQPLWRREGRVLQGIGFNYDFADDEGPALDLRSGRPIGQSQGPSVDLVQVGDVLVTTGLDGVFPKGLNVAEVTTLQPLREGDYYFELEAQASAGDLDALSLVAVLPPLLEGFQPNAK